MAWEQEFKSYITGPSASEIGVSDGEERDPLIFWRNNTNLYPTLSRIARKVFVIQSSSAQSERVFSDAGLVATAKRSTMDADTLEELVVLKSAMAAGIW